MRRITSFLSCSLLALACGWASAAEIPPIVTELARAYSASRAVKQKGASGRTELEEYSAYFFMGFTHQHGGILNASEIDTTAYTQGQVYWRDHPAERDAIFPDYGYRHVEATGIWSRSFERRSFSPRDQNSENWWLSPLGDVAWEQLKPNQPHPISCRSSVRIAGYLSPVGHYGHLGAYGHEFLATSVACDA